MSDGVLGIDLGTTYSAVAVVLDGVAQLIPTRQGGRLTPSMVGFTYEGQRVVGLEAQALAEIAPERVASATKRFIGRRYSEELAEEARKLVPYQILPGPQSDIRVKLGDQVMPLTQIAAMILLELKLDAQAFLGKPITQAVITVPASFDDGQRQATKEAARIAGLDVLRLVNEPTAAALAYGLQYPFQGRALVFDLGGGTFDVSVLEVSNGEFDVVCTGGDPLLGGNDFDNRIAQWLLAQVPDHFREVTSHDPLSLQRLLVAAEQAKRALTEVEEVIIEVAGLGDHSHENPQTIDLTTTLTRHFFEILSEPLSRRCLHVCEEVMVEGHMSPSSIDALLLVGGMTRVPLVRRLVKEYFTQPVREGVDPDEVVAKGAALYGADLVAKQRRSRLKDVTSHSLGVGIAGGRMRRLIEKNTPIPFSAEELFLPGRDGQTQARISIYEGEGDMVDQNTLLGEVVVGNLRGLIRADNELKVTFGVAADGTLTVQALDVTTGRMEVLSLQSRTELQPQDIARLAREQVQHADVSMGKEKARMGARLGELTGRGKELLEALRGVYRKHPGEEVQALYRELDGLLKAIGGNQAPSSSNDPVLWGRELEQLERLVSSVEKLVAASG
jgi:molecular chaperone DnaK